MLKNTLILAIFITALSANATVSDSAAETTEKSSGQALVEENFKNISKLKDNMSKIEDVMAKFSVCEAKNKIYLGSNVPSADSDDCVDIQNMPVKRKSKKPVFAGFITNNRLGSLVEVSGNYDLSNTDEVWGRARADYLCNAKFTGARALTADDIKYVYNSLINQISGGYFNNGNEDSKYIWLFDGWESYETNIAFTAKYPFDKDVVDCRAWNSTMGSGHVLELDTSTSNYYIKQNVYACNQKAIVACVQ